MAFEKFNLALKIYYKLNKSTIVILFNNVGRLYECHDMNIEATEYYIRALITAE